MDIDQIEYEKELENFFAMTIKKTLKEEILAPEYEITDILGTYNSEKRTDVYFNKYMDNHNKYYDEILKYLI